MSVDEHNLYYATVVEPFPDSAEPWAGLFAPDVEVREAAIAAVAREGASAVSCLAQIAQRPLGYALDCWPEWQQMLPAQAILARCRFARQAALQAMSQIGSSAVGELSRLLECADASLREPAADALRRMDSPEAITALRQSLEQELAFQKQERRRANLKRCVVSLTVTLLLLAIAPVCGVLPVIGWCVAPVFGLLAWLLLAFTDYGAGVRRTAVTALGETGDKRHIGLLTACLDDPNGEVRQAVTDALTHLLPQARIQDRAHITKAERAALLRALDGNNPDLAVAILAAMQHIGDEQMLRRVAFLIDSPVHYKRVREAAHECLPHVKQRIKEAQDAQALLRAAPQQAVVSATLLRPIREQAASVHEEQLLRPR